MNLTILRPYYYGRKTWRPYPCLSAALTFYWDQSCVNEGGGGRRGMGMGVGWGSGGGQSQWLYCVYRMRLCFRVSICLCVTENTSILFCLWNSSILFCQDCVSVCPSIYVSLKIHLYCSAYEMHLYILFAKIFCPSVYMSMKVHLYCSAYEIYLSIVFGL